MQETTDISQKVFSELKEILKNLQNCWTIEEFLESEIEYSKLQEYTTFLKVYKNFKRNNEISEGFSSLNSDEGEILNEDYEKLNEEILEVENPNFEEDEIVKNYSATNEDEVLKDFNYSSLDFEGEDEIVLEQEIELEINNNADREKDNTEEENNQLDESFISSEEVEELELKHQEERKFRLSNIKGVKKMETLFEDDFFEDNSNVVEQAKDSSLIKNNVPLDFMEVEKTKPLFKLDLNDRIAFTKKLFSGSQADLNNAVSRLNEFATLEEAKEYLSELYYKENWDKEDEFAQRLWNLVESKFQ